MFYLIRVNKFTIKEISDPGYLIYGKFKRIKELKYNNEILTWVSKTYFKRMMENFNNNFGFDLSKQHSDMPPNYKPGMDTTGLCKDAKKYKY